jgi:allantoinase
MCRCWFHPGPIAPTGEVEITDSRPCIHNLNGRDNQPLLNHMYNLIIRNAILITEPGELLCDLAIADGGIAAYGPQLAGMAQNEIDATGLHIFPGGIDPHVHCNEPGRTEWEGFAAATAALAAGGVTCFFDMPLNAHPPTCDVASFDAKMAAAHAHSLIDFRLWGGLVPGNLNELEGLAARGVIGFKAFMSTTGTDDFQPADDLTLYEGMRRAAQLGKIVAVHAENRTITDGLARQAQHAGLRGARDYLRSRPAIAEYDAIQRAILFAEDTQCALHIVHVSTGRGVALVAEAQIRGVNVSCETCPHYLIFSEEDVEQIGALAKCAPPIRSSTERNALWDLIMSGTLSIVASDHSPAPPDMKQSDDFFAIWGGISGCQSTLPLLLTAGHFQRQIALPTIANITATATAKRFGLWPQKGCLQVGSDADLALVDLNHESTLRTEDLYYRHRQSPYVGMQLRGKVVQTFVRGKRINVEADKRGSG